MPSTSSRPGSADANDDRCALLHWHDLCSRFRADFQRTSGAGAEKRQWTSGSVLKRSLNSRGKAGFSRVLGTEKQLSRQSLLAARRKNPSAIRDQKAGWGHGTRPACFISPDAKRCTRLKNAPLCTSRSDAVGAHSTPIPHRWAGIRGSRRVHAWLSTSAEAMAFTSWSQPVDSGNHRPFGRPSSR